MNLTAVEIRSSLSTVVVQHGEHEQRAFGVLACLRPCSARSALQRKAQWIVQTSALTLRQTTEEAVRAVMVSIIRKDIEYHSINSPVGTTGYQNGNGKFHDPQSAS